MFRLIPAFARAGLDWEDVGRVEPPSLAGWLLSRHAREFSWPANAFCGRCSWRYVCGGADGWDGRADPAAAVLRVACEHRKAFLQLFVREKAQFLLPGVSV